MSVFRAVEGFRAPRFLAFLTGFLIFVSGAASARAAADPPGRVGRLNEVQGQVGFSPAGSDEWVEAGTTRPVTTGDRVWMGRGARSELSIGSAILRADEESSLKVLQLDDDQAQFQLSQGTLAVQVRSLDPDDRLEIATPNLALVIDQPGDYRIQVDPDNDTTEVLVRRGRSTAFAEDGRHRLDAPSRARFTSNQLDRMSDNLPGPDDFDRWVQARIERAASRESARYLSRDMVGYEDLDEYGSWRDEPGYGPMWIPRVTIAGWAPYRHGHWTWIAPWGWTWVDDAPWGFAPFHYGRWAYVGGYWGWIPGPVVRRPYYAPALVAFIGNPGGWSLSIASGPAVAWFPLGYREEYRPVYRHGPTYITRINRGIVIEGDGGRRPPPGHYANRQVPGAATVVPASSFVEGRPVHRETLRVSERELERAPVGATMPALAPVRNSLVGHERRLAPPPAREPRRPVLTTRNPGPPPAERDELARRFSQEGGRVRDAGPPLTESPPRAERNEGGGRPRTWEVPSRGEDRPPQPGPRFERREPNPVRSEASAQVREERRPGNQEWLRAVRPESIDQTRGRPDTPQVGFGDGPRQAAPQPPQRHERMEDMRRPREMAEPPRQPEFRAPQEMRQVTRPAPEMRAPEVAAPPPRVQMRQEREGPRPERQMQAEPYQARETRREERPSPVPREDARPDSSRHSAAVPQDRREESRRDRHNGNDRRGRGDPPNE